MEEENFLQQTKLYKHACKMKMVCVCVNVETTSFEYKHPVEKLYDAKFHRNERRCLQCRCYGSFQFGKKRNLDVKMFLLCKKCIYISKPPPKAFLKTRLADRCSSCFHKFCRTACIYSCKQKL